MSQPPITVIITAYNAAKTVGRAIRSAMQSDMVASVIVMNDASTDATTSVCLAEDDGSGRLLLIENNRNRGPAAGRNHALRFAHTPLVALLDADDYLIPGRFEQLLKHDGWDLIADNVCFIPEEEARGEHPVSIDTLAGGGRVRMLSLQEFALRNIAIPRKSRGELGFLKPVFRRDLFERFALQYDENLRLGEDFILYAQALARGAKFMLSESCGYVAVERADSLSGKHCTEDLEALARAAWELTRKVPRGPHRQALIRHNRALETRARHRRLLDDKQRYGMIRSLGRFIGAPRYLLPVVQAIYRDKRQQASARVENRTRFLFGRDEFERVQAQ